MKRLLRSFCQCNTQSQYIPFLRWHQQTQEFPIVCHSPWLSYVSKREGCCGVQTLFLSTKWFVFMGNFNKQILPVQFSGPLDTKSWKWVLYHFIQFVSHMTFCTFEKFQKIRKIKNKINPSSKKMGVTCDWQIEWNGTVAWFFAYFSITFFGRGKQGNIWYLWLFFSTAVVFISKQGI